MIEDVRSKGLELEKLESVTDTLGQTYVEGTDYTRTEETVADGTRMLLTFTQQGLQKLEQLGPGSGDADGGLHYPGDRGRSDCGHHQQRAHRLQGRLCA